MRRAGFAPEDKAFGPTSGEGDGTSLTSKLPRLPPEEVEATGVAEFWDGGAALAAPTVGAFATAGGSLRAGRACGEDRCDAAP